MHSLKEEAVAIPNQSAITKDNVTLMLDGILYIKVEDASKASYGVSDPMYAITQLAQTTMRSEIGKLTLDDTFLERDSLNQAINRTINSAASNWGIRCLRYEIRDIVLPPNIKQAMERQAEAERRKRADILHSEGEQQSEINLATARKSAIELEALGEAEAIFVKAKATANAVRLVTESLRDETASKAVTMQLAEKYIDAFGNLAKESNTLIIPAHTNDVSSFVSQSIGIFKAINNGLSYSGVSNQVDYGSTAANMNASPYPHTSKLKHTQPLSDTNTTTVSVEDPSHVDEVMGLVEPSQYKR